MGCEKVDIFTPMNVTLASEGQTLTIETSIQPQTLDILDYDGTISVGKPLGVDILEQKITIPLLGAFANAGAGEEARVRELVRGIVDHPENRDEIVSFVKANGGIDYAVRQLEKYVGQAVDALSVLEDSRAKEMLVELAHFTARRVF